MARIIWSSSDMVNSYRNKAHSDYTNLYLVCASCLCVRVCVCMRERERVLSVLGSYSDSCAEQWWRVCEQVLGGLFHSAGVQQRLHCMLSGESHVH